MSSSSAATPSSSSSASLLEYKWYGPSSFLLFSHCAINPTPTSSSSPIQSTVHNLPTSSPYESLPFGAFSRPFSSSSSCSLPRNSTPGCTSLPSSSSSFGKSSESRLLCIHSPIPPIPEALRQARIEARALWEKHRISQTEDERSTTTTEADGGGSAGGLEGGDEGEGQRSIKEGEKKKKTHTTDRKKTSSHGDRDDVASKEAFNKFFSDDANERLLGAASIRFLAELLGPSRHELFSFLTTFLDTEDNRLVLEMIGRELADLLSEEELSLLEEKETENGKRVPGEGGEKEDMQTSFSHRRQATVDEAFLLFSLLSTLLTGHDRAIRETALAGVHRLFRFHALEPRRTKNRYFSSSDDREQIQTFPEGEGESTGLSSRRKSSQGSSLQRGGGNHVHLDRGMCLLIANMSTNQAILPNVLLPSIYHMTARDGNARYQIASVLLLPLTAYYLQIFLVELESLIDACRPHEAGVCTPSHGGFSPESNGEGEQEEKNEVETPVGDLLRPFQANLQRQIESIVDDYIRLCTDESALHMQLQAGGQLPVFIAYCSSAAVMHYTQRRKKKAFAKKKTSKNSSSEETGKKGVEEREKDSRGEQDEEEDDHDGRSSPWGAEEKRILHLLYEAVSSFVRSSSDTLKMVGVEALAAMADRGPLSLFKSVVDNLLPMLCADPVWRVRAAVCERLDKIGRFLVASASTPSDEIDALLKKRESSKKGEENEKEENDEDGCSLPSASLGSGTCLVSVLVQFLKDRELNVKSAALRMTRKLVRMTKNCSGLLPVFLEEGESLCNNTSITQEGSPIFVECMDTVCAMLEVATTDEDKWQLTIFAFSLLRVDDWYVAMAFLEHLKIFISSPPPSFLSVLLTRLNLLVRHPASRWRVRARLLQNLPPVLLLPCSDGEETSDQLWLLLMHLLQDDVWAVRQEGPTALEYLVENAILSPLYEEENRRVKLLREGSKTSRFFERKGSSSSFTSLASMGGSRTSRNFEGGDEKNEVKKKEKEDGAVSIALAREAILIDRLIPILDELAQDKRYFVRGETCRYILAIYRYFSPSVWKHQLSPLLERIAQDEVPQARYAAAKAVEILELQASQRGEIEGDDSSCVSTSATTTTSPKEDFFLERSWIDAMKKKFLQDEDEDVASVFSPPFDDE